MKKKKKSLRRAILCLKKKKTSEEIKLVTEVETMVEPEIETKAEPAWRSGKERYICSQWGASVVPRWFRRGLKLHPASPLDAQNPASYVDLKTIYILPQERVEGVPLMGEVAGPS